MHDMIELALVFKSKCHIFQPTLVINVKLRTTLIGYNRSVILFHFTGPRFYETN